MLTQEQQECVLKMAANLTRVRIREQQRVRSGVSSQRSASETIKKVEDTFRAYLKEVG